jgi:hypothetical protein
MLRRKATIILFAAATLGACGRLPTAPIATKEAGTQPAVRMPTSTIVADQQRRGSAAMRSERRDRSKYSVIFF